jgi:hypothetical protein
MSAFEAPGEAVWLPEGEAPYDEPNTGSRRAPERHQRAGLGFHPLPHLEAATHRENEQQYTMGATPLLRLALTPVITPRCIKQRAEIPPSARCQVIQFCLSTMYLARLYNSSKVMISMPCIDLLNL